MPNVAVLVGNVAYRHFASLECCKADVQAMSELLQATQKYESIEIISDADASTLKRRLRDIVDASSSPGEIFFYYTGHGFAFDGEFFFCATDFDPARPNETGLSTIDLHTFLRMANADLVVKVVDACNSGTHLVKSEIGLSHENKKGFKNLIQISSCLDTQLALTGDPLSLFTQKFQNAALRKTEGTIYYTDLISSLRDEFIGSENQIPFFVSQHTGREQFVDSADKLKDIRLKYGDSEQVNVSLDRVVVLPPDAAPSLIDMLAAAQRKAVTPDRMEELTGNLFSEVRDLVSRLSHSDIFDTEYAEHDDFKEPTAKRFVIEVLRREKRVDNFVTAEVSRKQRRTNPWLGSTIAALTQFYDDEQFIETHDLTLNCKMNHAQLRVVLTPKFANLQKIMLVLTCAPSLESCYVMEVVTQHMMHDFNKFDIDGAKIVQRWYKLGWEEAISGIEKKVVASLDENINSHVESTIKRLSS